LNGCKDLEATYLYSVLGFLNLTNPQSVNPQSPSDENWGLTDWGLVRFLRRFLHADVFVPELRVLAYESLHHRDAGVVLEDTYFNTERPQQILFAEECAVFSYDDFRDSIEKDRPGAHGARGQRCVDDTLSIDSGGLSSRVFERVHLAMKDNASFLNTPIMAPAEDPVLMDQHRTDGDTALAQARFGLLHCSAHEFVHGLYVTPRRE
jgi:hypothetical protein